MDGQTAKRPLTLRPSAGIAGGILNASGALTISSSTIAPNTCGLGAGVTSSTEAPSLFLKNSIVANNTATGYGRPGGDCSGTVISQGYNLIRNGTDSSVVGNNSR